MSFKLVTAFNGHALFEIERQARAFHSNHISLKRWEHTNRSGLPFGPKMRSTELARCWTLSRIKAMSTKVLSIEICGRFHRHLSYSRSWTATSWPCWISEASSGKISKPLALAADFKIPEPCSPAGVTVYSPSAHDTMALRKCKRPGFL